MSRAAFASIIAIFVFAVMPAARSTCQTVEQIKFVHDFPAMGVEFRIIAFIDKVTDQKRLKQTVEKRVKYLESVLSDYQKNSEINRISAKAPHTHPIEVSPELTTICRRSQQLVELTDGAFDPSIGAVSKVWRFARKRNRMPDPSRIVAAMKSVGWHNVEIAANNHIAIKQSGLQLDFGGIAKGFAADEVLQLLKQHSVTAALIDAGGDIRTGGAPVGKRGWTIGTSRSIAGVPPLSLSNVGVATSGATQQRLLDRGKNYSHIIDPRNGQPVNHHWNVTVIAPDATTADALASAFSVLGKDESVRIANASNEFFVMLANTKTGEICYSNGFTQFTKK